MALKILKPSLPTLSGRTLPLEPKQADQAYRTPEHAAWSKQVLQQAGYRCERCGRAGRLYADHIIELKDGGPALDISNGQALCGSCHTTKTYAARRERFDLLW